MEPVFRGECDQRTKEATDVDATNSETQAPRSRRSASAAWACPDFYGPADRAESIATIHAALEAGITLLDTGDFYGMGHNELLIREALKGRSRATICRSASSSARCATPTIGFHGIDTRPAAMKNFVAYSLQRLGVETHRHLSSGAARSQRADRGDHRRHRRHGEGRLCASHRPLGGRRRDHPPRAQAVHPIVDLQIEYSLISRGIEDEILPACRELGIGITAYGVLSRGLISGHWSKDVQRRRLSAPHSPRFQAGNVDAIWRWSSALREVADDLGVTVAQIGDCLGGGAGRPTSCR